MSSKHLAPSLTLGLGLIATNGHAEVALPGALLTVHNATRNATCVNEPALERRVRGQIGRTSTGDASSLRIEVAVRATWSGFVAELRLSGRGDGVREIEASRCEGLLDALSVTIAMIIDRDAEERAAVTPPSTTAAVAPNDATRSTTESTGAAPASNDPVRDAPDARRTPRGSLDPTGREPLAPGADSQQSGWFRLAPTTQLRAWFGTGWGTSGSWQVESGLAFYVGNWGWSAGGFWQPTHSATLGAGQVRTMTVGGVVAGCLRTGADWRGLFCLRADLGGKRVSGEGFDETTPSRVLPVFRFGPSIGVESGGRWIFGLDLLGMAAAWKDSYVVANGAAGPSATGPSAAGPSDASVALRDAPPLFSAWLVARVALSTGKSRQ